MVSGKIRRREREYKTVLVCKKKFYGQTLTILANDLCCWITTITNEWAKNECSMLSTYAFTLILVLIVSHNRECFFIGIWQLLLTRTREKSILFLRNQIVRAVFNSRRIIQITFDTECGVVCAPIYLFCLPVLRESW